MGRGHRPRTATWFLGPCAGRRATWQEDPETLPLFHVIVSANPMISGAAIPAAQAALGERWTPVQLHVDGALRPFKMVRRGVHWGALRRIEPDTAIEICASNIEPDAVRLEQIRDLTPYFDGA